MAEGKLMQSSQGIGRPQGVAVVPRLNCVAVACGGDGLLRVYDAQSLKELHTIEAGPDADNVRYHAKSDTLWVSYGDTNNGAIAVFEPGFE